MSVRTFSVKEHKQTHRFKTAIDKNVIPQVITGVGWGYDEGYLDWEKKVLKNRLPNTTVFIDNDKNPEAKYYDVFDGNNVSVSGLYITYPIPYGGSARCKITATTMESTPYAVSVMSHRVDPEYTTILQSGESYDRLLDSSIGLNSNDPAQHWYLDVDLTDTSSNGDDKPLVVVCDKGDNNFSGDLDIDVGDFFYFFPQYINGSYVGPIDMMDIEVYSHEYLPSYLGYGTRLYIIKKKSINNDTAWQYTLSLYPYNTEDPEANQPIYTKEDESPRTIYGGNYLPYEPCTIKVVPLESNYSDLSEVTIGQVDANGYNATYDNCRFVNSEVNIRTKLRICSMNLTEFTSGLTETISNKTTSLTTCESMFEGCGSLRTVHPINGSPVSLKKMFKDCVSLKAVPYIRIENALTTESMFENCTSLVEVSSLYGPENMSTQLTDIRNMFKNCRSLQLLSYFETWNVQLFDGFLHGCQSLQFLPGLYFNSMIPADNLSPFGENYSLVSGSFDTYKTMLLDLTNTRFSGDRLNTIFSRLFDATLSQDKPTIIITGCTGANDCDTSIATAKDWIVVSS